MAKVIALFPAHPAQLWLMLAVKAWIEDTGQDIQFRWFFRDKDVTLSLASSLGIEGVVVSKASSGLAGNAFELFINIGRCLYYTKKYDVDLWLTKYGCGNIAARILGKKNISFNDDDEDVVPLIARTSYPFADRLLFPKFTRNSKYLSKAIFYNGLHEVAYLTENRIKPDSASDNCNEKYAFIRISALKAHHDVGHSGISVELLDSLVEQLESRNVKVYISSESNLPPRFFSKLRKADVSTIHDFLRGACFYVGDSQTMAIEACLLGVPTMRISDFQELSVINHLEAQGLIKSFAPDDVSALKYLSAFLDNYEQRYSQFNEHVRRVRSGFDDTREVFGKAILELLQD